MTKLTWDNLESEVVRLAKENPDYVDLHAAQVRGCSYLPSGIYKGCIVGQALTNLGVDATMLYRLEQLAPNNKVFAEQLNLPFSQAAAGLESQEPAARRITAIQGRQDRAYSWGHCVEKETA